MSTSKRSVADFLRTAFQDSTIPFDKSRLFKDYSFNFREYDSWSTGKRFTPNAEACLYQFPIWPADLFAVTSSLLERSAAYQRLANAIQPVGPARPDDPKWSVELKPASPVDADDIFGVRNPHRLLLRLVGALWGFGALLVSGLYDESKRLSKEALAARNMERAKDAIAFIKERMNQEIHPVELQNACEAITDYVFNRLQLGKLAPDFDEIGNNEASLLPTAAARLAYHIIRTHHAEEAANSDGSGVEEKERELGRRYNQHGKKAVEHYCLILWASEYLQFHWDILRTSDRPISLPIRDPKERTADHQWWRAATRLLIIADEAGKGMGFSGEPDMHQSVFGSPRLPPEVPDHQQAGLDCRTIFEHYQAANDLTLPGPVRNSTLRFPRTLARCFEEELGSVLPKARTPPNGCTIRSLSHNFALLPPKGRIRARWARQSRPKHKTTYNILIVPYPYQIKSRHVCPTSPEDSRDDWGFFIVKPDWLYELERGHNETEARFRTRCRQRFWDFLRGLMDDQPENTINAIMLPEAALDWETFNYVQSRLPTAYPFIEMLVCGLTSYRHPGNKVPQQGNWVATYMRRPMFTADGTEKGRQVWAFRHVRAKHHRWKLEARQLRSYALSHRLAPDKMWWEDIRLPPREMLFAEFSPGSIMTSLICEDLARIEPCQVALRSVGPNLVLVLLMDTAQILQRWPYQYAGVLADDPGSSVLTLTSFGLIKRSNLSEDRSSRQIAIWREPHAGTALEINLPVDYDAQLVSIRREFCLERSLDGRGDNNDSAVVWKFAGLIPIRTKVVPPGGKPDT